MIFLPIFAIAINQTPRSASLAEQAEHASHLLFGVVPGEKPWKSYSDEPLIFTSNISRISFSNRYSGRIFSIGRVDIGQRMRNGPKQGELFKSRAEWEEFGFKQIHKIWSDIDGYAGSFRRIGEVAFVVAGRKSWESNSNLMSITWFTFPVNGMQRQFDVSMDLATGNVIWMSCSNFAKAPSDWNTRKSGYIRMDNSKKRRTKVALPPAN